MGISDSLVKVLAGDPLSRGGTFGGEQCAQFVSEEVKLLERVSWISLCVLVFFLFSLRQHFCTLRDSIREQLVRTSGSVSSWIRLGELFVGYACVGMFVLLCVFKANSHSLCYIIQPCHIIILSQGLMLIRDDEYTAISQLMLIPTLGGTVLALLFPETEDLVQPFEETLFWIEHYTLQLLPLYLLLRRDGLLLKNISVFTALSGGWVLICHHYMLIDIMNAILKTNVQFMHCPIPPAKLIMSFVNPAFLKPSFRTFFTLTFVPLSVFGSESYRLLANLIKLFLPKAAILDEPKKFC